MSRTRKRSDPNGNALAESQCVSVYFRDMRARFSVFLGVTAALAACGGGTSSAPPSPATAPADPAPASSPAASSRESAYPATRRDATADVIHGASVADPYRWLEDPSRPEVQAWMTAQQAVTRAQLDRLPRRKEIAARIAELAYFDAPGVPIERKGRLFWNHKHKDKEKAVLYWKQASAASASPSSGKGTVLLDPNGWTADGSTSLGNWWPSPDGRLLAFQRKVNNSDEAVLHVIDVASGKELPDVIPGAKYGGAKWTPSGEGFYYTWVPPLGGNVTVADRPGFAEVRFHRLGTDPARDPVAFPATGNPRTFVGAEISDDGKWLVAGVQHGRNATDLYLLDRTRKAATWQTLVEGVPAVFQVKPGGHRFYVRTNQDAPRFRVLAVDPRKPDRKHWKEIVGESDATIDEMEIIGGRIFLTYLRDATSAIEIRRPSGALAHRLALPPFGQVSDLHGTFRNDTAYFQYSSFTEQAIVFQTSAKTGALTEWSRVKLPLDPSQIETKRVRYRSRDGTEVAMFLVHKKGAPRNGANPTILWGYGGFSIPMLPGPTAGFWQWPWAAWIEMGGLLAVANLRGGNELGEEWHKAGMLLVKQNVFDDYLAAARYLIAEKWTSPAHLAAMGRSNGGLLVGAAMTQAPQLFKAVVCGVPLLDMVRYHLFGSGKTWIPEYGSAEDPEQFRALFAYSPYHRMKEGAAYPALLMLSTDSDDRVDPMHARKFTAALQHASRSDRPVLLHIERHAGHGGADMVKQAVEQYADQYAFLAWQLGFELTATP